ncbi:unnamed protein product [Lactuca virosa]|uniref:Uncharacterized protein n=1 Tax=Lactuca virosa TaxID=75947 RepID=A0AAU9LUS3_9ASTR|nr:unnamed protein product [Lactuca virosa]
MKNSSHPHHFCILPQLPPPKKSSTSTNPRCLHDHHATIFKSNRRFFRTFDVLLDDTICSGFGVCKFDFVGGLDFSRNRKYEGGGRYELVLLSVKLSKLDL